MEEATDGLSKGLVRCACNEPAVMTLMRAMYGGENFYSSSQWHSSDMHYIQLCANRLHLSMHHYIRFFSVQQDHQSYASPHLSTILLG
jgi:hypothetical protein